MAFWAYQLIDKTGKVIAMDTGFETEEDAEFEANLYKRNNLEVRTFQIWEEL